MAIGKKAKGGIAAGVAAVVLVTGGLVAQNVTEDNTKTIDGQLLIAHGDNFVTGETTQVTAEVVTDTQTYKLPEVSLAQSAQYHEFTGQQVEVEGSGGTSNFKPNKIKHSNKHPKQPAKSIPHNGIFRVAVIVMHPTGSKSEPWTIKNIQDNMFGTVSGWTCSTCVNSGGSVSDFYSKASNGAMTLSGQIFGYLDSPTAQNCDLSTVSNLGITAAQKVGYNAADFDDFVVITQGTTCSFSGQAWVGCCGVQMNGNIATSTFIHELGHNLGVWHAGSLQCSPNPVSYAESGCLYSAYGDYYDIMGGGLHYFDAEHKWHMTWLANESRVTAPVGTNTFTIAPSEVKSSIGVTQEVIVPRGTPDGSFWTFEYRYSTTSTKQPYQSGDFDSDIPVGIWVHLIRFQGTSDTLLVDATPGAGGTGHDWFLPVGVSNTLPLSGNNTLTVTTISAGGANAVIQIVNGGVAPPTTTPKTTTTTRPTGTTTTTIKAGTPIVTASVQADKTVKLIWSQPTTYVKTQIQISRTRTPTGRNITARLTGTSLQQGFYIDTRAPTGTSYYTVRFITAGTATVWSSPSVITK